MPAARTIAERRSNSRASARQDRETAVMDVYVLLRLNEVSRHTRLVSVHASLDGAQQAAAQDWPLWSSTAQHNSFATWRLAESGDVWFVGVGSLISYEIKQTTVKP
jgi:hypothetical protein